MSSRKGKFQHNNVYKIMSMKDKNVIELSSSGTLVVKKSTNAINQKFKTVQISNEEFRISCLAQTGRSESELQVWDFLPSTLILIQNLACNGVNQSWVAEEIYPNSKICFIKSKNDGKCLRNMGIGKEITIVPEDRRDPNVHWKIDPTYGP